MKTHLINRSRVTFSKNVEHIAKRLFAQECVIALGKKTRHQAVEWGEKQSY